MRTITYLLLGVTTLLMIGCESPEEKAARRNASLIEICIRRHSHPIIENGKFKDCEPGWNINLKTKKE